MAFYLSVSIELHKSRNKYIALMNTYTHQYKRTHLLHRIHKYKWFYFMHLFNHIIPTNKQKQDTTVAENTQWIER